MNREDKPQITKSIWSLLFILLLAGGLVSGWNALTAPAAEAGLYWRHGVLDKYITVCFVGDAVTSRPDRVEETVTYLQEFEYAANIRFISLAGQSILEEITPGSGGGIGNLACPPPTTAGNGDSVYAGDIRVVLRYTNGTKVASWPGEEGTGPVPGKGCPMFLDDNGDYCDSTCNPDSNNDGGGSWSNAPDDLADKRSCLYNLKVSDVPESSPPPYLDHTLHEFGHALGLAHEHARTDVNVPGCTEEAIHLSRDSAGEQRIAKGGWSGFAREGQSPHLSE